jgi:hypothetical protein
MFDILGAEERGKIENMRGRISLSITAYGIVVKYLPITLATAGSHD